MTTSAANDRRSAPGRMHPMTSDFTEERIVKCELRLTVVDKLRNNLLAAKLSPHIRERHVERLDALEAAIKRTSARTWALRVRTELLHAARPWPTAILQNACESPVVAARASS